MNVDRKSIRTACVILLRILNSFITPCPVTVLISKWLGVSTSLSGNSLYI